MIADRCLHLLIATPLPLSLILFLTKLLPNKGINEAASRENREERPQSALSL